MSPEKAGFNPETETGFTDENLKAVYPKLLAFCRSLTRDSPNPNDEALDLAQITMQKAWTARKKFENRAKLLTWLISIAHNACSGQLSRRAKRHFDDPNRTEPLEDSAAALPSTTQEENRAVLRLTFSALLGTLPPTWREILELREIQGLKVEEIAELKGMPESTVKFILLRARRKLSELLEEKARFRSKTPEPPRLGRDAQEQPTKKPEVLAKPISGPKPSKPPKLSMEGRVFFGLELKEVAALKRIFDRFQYRPFAQYRLDKFWIGRETVEKLVRTGYLKRTGTGAGLRYVVSY